MADRFFCPVPPVHGVATLEGDEARHLARVCRVAVGECVELFDGRGGVFEAEVTNLRRDAVTLRVVAHLPPGPAPACHLTLATAVPKGDRFDWLVEKASELGVARLVPLATVRSVVDPRTSKLDRLRRTAVESAKQSKRDRVMEIEPPAAWGEYLTQTRSVPLRYLADPAGVGLAGWEVPSAGSPAVLAVGPEGGFTADEVGAAVDAGWRLVALGPHILRVETAAVAGSALVLALAGTTGPEPVVGPGRADRLS